MRGEKKDVARPELFSGVIRYSRIEPSESDQKPDAAVGAHLNRQGATDIRKAERRAIGGGATAATRISAAVLFVIGVAAIGASVTMIARSSFYSGDGAEGKKPIAAAKPGVSVTVAFLPQSGVAQRLAPRSVPIVAVPPGSAPPVQPVAPAAPEMPEVAAATQPSLQLPNQAPAVKQADVPASPVTVAELPDVAAATQPAGELPAQPPASQGTDVALPSPTAASAVKASTAELQPAAAPTPGEVADAFIHPSRPTIVAANRVSADEATEVQPASGREIKPSNRIAPKLARKSAAARVVKDSAVAQSVASAPSADVGPPDQAPVSSPATNATLLAESTSAAEIKPVFRPAPGLDREPTVSRLLPSSLAASVETKATPMAARDVAAIAPGDTGPMTAEFADATPLARGVEDLRPPAAGKTVASFAAAHAAKTDIPAVPVSNPAGTVLASIGSEAAAAVEPDAALPGKTKAGRKAASIRPPAFAAAKPVKGRETVRAIPPSAVVAAGAPLADATEIASAGAAAIVAVPLPAQLIDRQPSPARPLYGEAAPMAIATDKTVEPLAPDLAAVSGPRTAQSVDRGEVSVALAVPPVATNENADRTPSPVASLDAGAIRSVAEARPVTLEPPAAVQSGEKTAAAIRSLAPVGELAEIRPAEVKPAPTAAPLRSAEGEVKPALTATPLRSAETASAEGQVSAPLDGDATDAVPTLPARMATAPATVANAPPTPITAGQVPAPASQPEVAALSPATVDDGTTSGLPEDIAKQLVAKAGPQSSQATKPEAVRKADPPVLRPAAAETEPRDKTGETAKTPQEPRQGTVAGWRVLAVRGGIALIDGGDLGVFKVRSGTQIPGVGKVHAIKQQRGRWTVITSVGPVVSAANESGSAGY